MNSTDTKDFKAASNQKLANLKTTSRGKRVHTPHSKMITEIIPIHDNEQFKVPCSAFGCTKAHATIKLTTAVKKRNLLWWMI